MSNGDYTDYILNICDTLYYKRVERLNDLELLRLISNFFRTSELKRESILNNIINYFKCNELTNDYEAVHKSNVSDYTLYASPFEVMRYRKLFVELEGGEAFERLVTYDEFEEIFNLINRVYKATDYNTIEYLDNTIESMLEI